jgi:shikimate kinase
MATPTKVVLVGLMGTGKTTVGTLLAERLGYPFIDTDDVIWDRTGRTVRQIFEEDGEPAFRRLETEVLVDSLAPGGPAVIAAAGGVVLNETNRQALRGSDAHVVWLRAKPAVLVDRVAGQGHRPLLDDDPAATLAAMHASRDALYAEVADSVIDVDDRTPEDVLAKALEEIDT